jgi:predicted nucleic acid-binding protein
MIALPRRIFFDTNVVNFVLDHDGYIFENEALNPGLSDVDRADAQALQMFFTTGERVHWEMVVSYLTYGELAATPDRSRRQSLQRFCDQIWEHWRVCFDEDGTLDDNHALDLERRLEGAGLLSAFRDKNDRALIAHAIAYDCDAFMTRDRRSILRAVGRAKGVPLEFISPSEWGARVFPYLGLF